jgi:hypothetical protein
VSGATRPAGPWRRSRPIHPMSTPTATTAPAEPRLRGAAVACRRVTPRAIVSASTADRRRLPDRRMHGRLSRCSVTGTQGRRKVGSVPGCGAL